MSIFIIGCISIISCYLLYLLYSNYRWNQTLSLRNRNVPKPRLPIGKVGLIMVVFMLVSISSLYVDESQKVMLTNERSIGLQSFQIEVHMDAYAKYLQQANLIEVEMMDLSEMEYVGYVTIDGVDFQIYFKAGKQYLVDQNFIYEVKK